MRFIYAFSKYVLFFLIYSILGAVIETLFRLVIDHQLYGVHGFLHLPLFPIYGFGAILIIKLLKPRIRHPVPLFISGALLASTLEFAASWLIELVFGDKIWNYGSMPFNLYGRVSLYSSLGFGLGAIVLVYFVHPIIEKLVKRLPKIPTIAIAATVLVVLLTDFVFSVIERLNS